MADPTVDDVVCKGTCNTRAGSIVSAKVAPDPLCFFHPATGAVLECPIESVAAVRFEIEHLNHLLDKLLTAQAATGEATQAVNHAQTHVDAPAEQAAVRRLDNAIASESKAREAMFKEFKDVPKFNDGANALKEILPLATHKGHKLVSTRRMTYVRSEKVKSHLRHYANLPGDAVKMKAFYSKNTDGKYELDQKKLSNALHNVKPKAGLAKADISWWAAGWAPEFVEGFNSRNAPPGEEQKKAQYEALPQDAMLQFSGGAALLRFFGGAGGEAKVDLSSKSIKDLLKGRGEVGAKVAATGRIGIDLASARINPTLFLPAKKGLHLSVAAGKNAKGGHQELELGYVRLMVEGELSASCGASAVAEVGLEFKLKADMTQGLRGASASKTSAALANPKVRVDDKRFQAEAVAKGELSAFAGAEAGAKVGGALQWQKTQSLDFKDFAKINAEGKAQVGGGVAAMFNIGYDEGKFKIRAKLGACVGLGLKGEINAEVGVVEIVEFDLWFKHQVYCAVDQNLQYFKTEAFDAFVYMKALAIAEGKQLRHYLGQELDVLATRWQRLLETAGEATLAVLEAANDYLLTSVAEAKGLLIGLLQKLEKDFENLRERIRRMTWRVMAAGQLHQEAVNVYQNIGPAVAPKGSEDIGRQWVVALVGEEQLTELEAMMKTEPTPGYSLAMVDSMEYRFQRGIGTHVAWQRTPFGQSNSALV